MTTSVPFASIATLVDNSWGSPGTPDNAYAATGKLILSVAATLCCDPIALSRYTNLPTPFIATALGMLKYWPDWTEAELELAKLLLNNLLDEAEIDDALKSFTEFFWMHHDTNTVELEKLWCELTGFVDD
jgi:hypothetical protein